MVRDDNEESGWRKVADTSAPTDAKANEDGPVAVTVDGDEGDMDEEVGGNEIVG